jgi:hypothetical protein
VRLVPRLAAVSFLTTSGQRGGVAGDIVARTSSDNVDAILTAVDSLDLTSAAILTAAGITDPDMQRSVLAALWATR